MDNDTVKTMLLNSDLKTIREYCSANKEAAKICEDDYFWQQLVQQHFKTDKKILSSWRSTYEMLNTPCYQVISGSHYPHNEIDLKTETFWDYDKALDYAVEEALLISGGLIGTAAFDWSQHSFSSEFRELVDDLGFEDLEGNADENPELQKEYECYVSEYRKQLRQVLQNGETITDQEYFSTVKILKKSIIA